MKRILLTFLCLLAFSCTALAANTNFSFAKPGGNVGVVIISGSVFKTPDFFNYAKDALMPKDKARYNVQSGNDVQSLYQSYWLDKGFINEQTPQKEDLLEFVSYSQFDKVVYIFITDSKVDQHFDGVWDDLFGDFQTIRASVDFKVFVCDKNDILKLLSTTKEGESGTSALRARRAAFRSAMAEMAGTIIPILNSST